MTQRPIADAPPGDPHPEFAELMEHANSRFVALHEQRLRNLDFQPAWRYASMWVRSIANLVFLAARGLLQALRYPALLRATF